MSMTLAKQTLERWLFDFEQAASKGDTVWTRTAFHSDAYWRDLVSFSWNIITCEGLDSISSMLQDCGPLTHPSGWYFEDPVTVAEDGQIEAWFKFDTQKGRGKGHLRLKDGLCRSLLTALTELKGFEEPHGERRDRGAEHGIHRGRQNWLQRRQTEKAELGLTRQPYCLIVGGGQAGLALAARLKRLKVPALIIDKHERIGDAWRKRYASLCLHDPVWMDHMPYFPFPDHWPVFTPKDKMGEWLDMYANVMELDCWTQTECISAHFDEHAECWRVSVVRNGETIVLQPTQLVLATGMSGLPFVPSIPGADSFLGQHHHSSQHTGGADHAGKNCVVIGSNNSAHDICADLWEHDAHVTMIQRSPTMVVRSESLIEVIVSRLFSESALKAGITTEKADFIAASNPFKMAAAIQKGFYAQIKNRDAGFYQRLRDAGFKLTFGEDETGLSTMYMRRGSGYYIDVGASELISNGQIKLCSGVEISRILPRSVLLSDGTELPADLIVYATGYGPMNDWAAKLISQEVADKVGKCWGLGSGTTKDPGPWEGELRNMWKPTHQKNLWFHGGNLAQARFYSLSLGLQIKARYENLATPVHCLAKVHHLK